jgi:hypothetical protein
MHISKVLVVLFGNEVISMLRGHNIYAIDIIFE